jgi:hypothetical protein
MVKPTSTLVKQAGESSRREPNSLKLFRMNLAMAFPTEGDEVFFSIGPELASRCNVVNFQTPS